MDLNELGALANRLLNTPIAEISGTPLTLVNLATSGLLLLLAIMIGRTIRRGADKAMDRRNLHDQGTRAIAARLINIVALTVGVSLALTNLGINLAAFFAAGAVLAVGIGLAFQNMAQNFLSGLILLFERSIKPGDVLEVEGDVVRVEKLGVRATVARTRDDEQVIIPNNILAQNMVTNYTMQDSLFRIRVPVGVTYDSDIAVVRDALESVSSDLDWAAPQRPPVVQMLAFGSSSVDFEVSVWTQDPWGAPRRASDLHEAIWYALKTAGVVIAFPQLDLHLDRPVTEAFERLPRAS